MRLFRLCTFVTVLVDFLKVVRLVFWSSVVGPGTNDELSLARATRSKVLLVSKSTVFETMI